jgi:hypothetical protein
VGLDIYGLTAAALHRLILFRIYHVSYAAVDLSFSLIC